MVVDMESEMPDLLPPAAQWELSLAISNTGIVPAGNFATTVYLSADTIPDSSDFVLEELLLGSLQPFEDFPFTFDLHIPALPVHGAWFVLVKTDSKIQIEELDESNNMQLIPVYISPMVEVKTTVILQGAYDSETEKMTTHLLEKGLLPLSQPYNRSPWHYAGDESVNTPSEFPPNTTDWILLELRNGEDMAEMVSQKAALLLNDGKVVDVATSGPVRFTDTPPGLGYYLVIRHRNHLAVASASPVLLPSFATYHFTTAATQAKGEGQLAELKEGVYGKFTADINSDGITDLNDLFEFSLAFSNNSDIFTYTDADLNLDGILSIQDYNWYVANSSLIGISEIRY